MIKLKNVTKNYGSLKVLDDITLELEDGKITCIIGGSGTGKSTLLNVLAGLTDFEGTVLTDNATVSYMFQSERLIPTLTARQNVEFVLGAMSPDERKAAADAMLSAVELTDFQNLYPKALSGGMKQRVAMARAFAYPSDVLLVDEPFKGLDMVLTEKLTKLFTDILQKDGRTVVYVTHNIGEAVLLADRIIVLSALPAKLVYDVNIDIPKDKRSLTDSKLFAIRNEIYTVLKENATDR